MSIAGSNHNSPLIFIILLLFLKNYFLRQFDHIFICKTQLPQLGLPPAIQFSFLTNGQAVKSTTSDILYRFIVKRFQIFRSRSCINVQRNPQLSFKTPATGINVSQFRQNHCVEFPTGDLNYELIRKRTDYLRSGGEKTAA
jgi:hypothetical protein